MKRIDHIGLTVDYFDDTGVRGRTHFSVDVTSQHDPLTVAVRDAWQKWYAAQMAKVRASDANRFPADPG